jgi:Mn-containing catalase
MQFMTVPYFITMPLVYHGQQHIFRLREIRFADLYEDIAAEEKARATYQWLINLSDDPDLNDGLRFLREREIIHAQRFREAVEILKEEQDQKKVF